MLGLDAEDEKRSELRSELAPLIEEVIEKAAREKKADRKKIDYLLARIDEVIPKHDYEYGVSWFDKARLKLLGVIPYCKRYKSKPRQ
jgi:hypothetical protein